MKHITIILALIMLIHIAVLDTNKCSVDINKAIQSGGITLD